MARANNAAHFPARETEVRAVTDRKRVFVGVDPGAKGAIVFLDEACKVDLIQPMPMRVTLKSDRARSTLDEWELARMVDDWATHYWLVRVAIEQQQAWGKGDNVMTATSLVGDYRSLRMCFIANAVPIENVLTRTWRKAAGIPVIEKDPKLRKQQSMARCQDLWPEMATKFRTDGPADAALIARWCLQYGGRQ